MESSETHQPVAEEEADQGRIHTRGLIQGPKTSSRLQSVKEVQSIPCAASKRFTKRSSPILSSSTRRSSRRTCLSILFSSISSSSPTWSTAKETSLLSQCPSACHPKSKRSSTKTRTRHHKKRKEAIDILMKAETEIQKMVEPVHHKQTETASRDQACQRTATASPTT